MKHALGIEDRAARRRRRRRWREVDEGEEGEVRMSVEGIVRSEIADAIVGGGGALRVYVKRGGEES